MQLRTLALLCSIVGFLYSGLASALGLGEITLKSQYNQPLNAEIRLLQVRDLSEEEILASLASRNDFNRAGVDRVFFLTGLNFEVVLDNPSKPFIRVTSRRPVTEPYLNFLLEVQWPSGRLLREYTLLLDLPVFAETSPAPTTISSPTTTTTVRSEPAPSNPSRVQTPSPRPVQTGPAPVNGGVVSNQRSPQFSQPSVDSYQVRRGDTLWEIAERVRPDTSTSVHQTMIALQQANPEAFVGGNINRLKNGRVLRVPDANEITQISYNQAVSAVRKQNQSWSSKPATKAVLTSSAPTTATASSGSQPEGRLTLGAADSGQGDVRGSGSSGSGESLQNELAIAKDELSRSGRENSELKSRVNELESQIETMEKLIQITNDQLKALQLAAQDKAADIAEPGGEVPADTAAAQVGDGEDAAEQIEEVVESTVEGVVGDGIESLEEGAAEVADELATTEESIDEVTEASADEISEEQAPAEDAPVVAETDTQSDIAPVEEKPAFDLLGLLKSNLLAVGGVLVALLLGLLVLLKLREKPEPEDYGEFDLAEDEELLEADDLEQVAAADELDLDEEEEDVEAQTEDVVAEADIYISLGQEDKAIELLQKEIQQNPDNADARLGLLKIYAKAQNASAFDEQYAQLLPLGNVYANDQAMALRKDISDVEPFDTDQYSTDADAGDAFDSLDLGDDSDGDLDFDLDLDLGDELGEAEELAEQQVDDSGLDDELDVDLGDLSLDLDEMDDTLGDLDIDSSLELDTDSDSFNLVDEMSDDLDSLDVDEIGSDDLDLNIESELDSALESLDDDIAASTAGLEADAGDLEFDLDFESADAAIDDELDLDAPPAEDLDLASLDEEIDAMTADLDESLPLDEGTDSSSASQSGASGFQPVVSPKTDFVGEEESASAQSGASTSGFAPVLASKTADVNDLPESEATSSDTAKASGFAPVLASKSEGLPELDGVDASLDLSESDSIELDLDDSLDLSVDESLDLNVEDSLDLNVEDSLLSSAEDELAALEESDDDLDILASSEMDVLNAEESADLSVDSLVDEDITVSSMADEVSISEDEELDFLEASDEVSTKLDLARAYIDMGDREGAEDILSEVIEEGNTEQKSEAQELMRSI